MLKKAGRLWLTKKEGSNVVLSGVFLGKARIGIIKAKDKNGKVIEGTFDLIFFEDDDKQSIKTEKINCKNPFS